MTTPDPKKINSVNYYSLNEYYVKIKIRDVEFFPQSILLLRIKEWVFDLLPRMEIEFLEDAGRFSDKYFIQEDDEIEIEVSKGPEDEPIIKNTFKVLDYTIDNGLTTVNDHSVIRLTAYLKSDGFSFPIKNRVFKNSSSSTVISKLANESGLTPDIRVETIDNQNWYQIDVNNMDMVKYVTQRAYHRDDDCIMTYTDRNGNIVVTSLDTEVKREGTKTAILDAPRSLNLLNNPSESEILYNNLQYVNVSGSLGKKVGYGISYSYYNFEENKTGNVKQNKFFMSDFPNKNDDNLGKIVKDISFGKLTGNLNPNYYKAIAQNEYYKNNFFGSYIVLSTALSYDIKLFEKINLIAFSKDETGYINNVLSGEYVVGGILHEISKSENYKMLITLFSGGYNKSSFEE